MCCDSVLPVVSAVVVVGHSTSNSMQHVSPVPGPDSPGQAISANCQFVGGAQGSLEPTSGSREIFLWDACR